MAGKYERVRRVDVEPGAREQLDRRVLQRAFGNAESELLHVHFACRSEAPGYIRVSRELSSRTGSPSSLTDPFAGSSSL